MRQLAFNQKIAIFAKQHIRQSRGGFSEWEITVDINACEYACTHHARVCARVCMCVCAWCVCERKMERVSACERECLCDGGLAEQAKTCREHA